MTDREKFIAQARTYIGKNGNYVCNTKLHLGYVTHWCAYSVSAIMQDCGFIGKYIKAVEGGAGSIPRESDGKYGTWFKKTQNMPPQSGDLFFMRYADYPNNDKYFCDHVGIVESVNGNTLTTLEGNVDGDYNGDWATTSTFKRKTRYLTSWEVYAFYRPKWQEETKTTTTSTTSKEKLQQLNSSKAVDYSVKITSRNGAVVRIGAAESYKTIGTIPYDKFARISRQTSGGGHQWGLATYGNLQGWITLDNAGKVDVNKLVKEVIAGKYGNGTERKRLLGDLYDVVQARVNEIYGGLKNDRRRICEILQGNNQRLRQ